MKNFIRKAWVTDNGVFVCSQNCGGCQHAYRDENGSKKCNNDLNKEGPREI